MILLDKTFATPQENLACDEALLEIREAHGGDEVLRFWQAPDYFAVLGYTNKRDDELNIESCERDGVPILRRVSGGGTVLHGPGSLCYALVLEIQQHHDLRNLATTNRFIMETLRDALAPLSQGEIAIRGTTDLALDDRKVSGNAQRRKKNWLLFHGTFLLNFELAQIERYLNFPPSVPDYRAARGHSDFVTNLHLEASIVKAALSAAWNARTVEIEVPARNIETLAREKYASAQWNQRF